MTIKKLNPEDIPKQFKPEDVELNLPMKGLEDIIVHYVATKSVDNNRILVVHATRFAKGILGLFPKYQTRAYIELRDNLGRNLPGEDVDVDVDHASRQIYMAVKRLYQAHPEPSISGMERKSLFR